MKKTNAFSPVGTGASRSTSTHVFERHTFSLHTLAALSQNATSFWVHRHYGWCHRVRYVSMPPEEEVGTTCLACWLELLPNVIVWSSVTEPNRQLTRNSELSCQGNVRCPRGRWPRLLHDRRKILVATRSHITRCEFALCGSYPSTAVPHDANRKADGEVARDARLSQKSIVSMMFDAASVRALR